MAYHFYIPIPEASTKRAEPIKINQLFSQVSPPNCHKSLRGVFSSCDAWLNDAVIDINSSILWRGNLARSWVIYYLRHYGYVSEHFLTHTVGIEDLTGIIQTLRGKKYRLPIIEKCGDTLNRLGNKDPCVWYGLDDNCIMRG